MPDKIRELPPDFNHSPRSIGEYQQAVAAAALLARDLDGVLRRGLVEETLEVVDAARPLTMFESSQQSTKKEFGDVMWYLLATSNQHGITFDRVIGADVGNSQSLSATLKTVSYDARLPIYDGAGVEIDRDATVNMPVSMFVDVLRIIDTLNPREDTFPVWHQIEHRPTLVGALHDALVSLAQLGESLDIDLADALDFTLKANRDRHRDPHVADQASDSRVDSVRGRLTSALGREVSASALGWYITTYHDEKNGSNM